MTNHDRLFKELVTTFFIEFLELFLPELNDYIEADSVVFLDKELFEDAFFRERLEVDVIAQARFKEQEATFVIHVENQASSQADFSQRIFFYFARLYERSKQKVYPIALFSFDEPARPEPDQHQMIFPNKTVLDFSFDTIQLNRLNWRDYLNRPNPVASALMTKMKIAPKDRPRVKLECIKMLAGLKISRTRKYFISSFVDTYLKLDAAEEQVFDKELEKVIPTQKEEVMQLTNSWTEKGKREGKLEGEREGKREGQLNFAMLLLSHRFGPLTPELETQVKQLSNVQIEELGKALFELKDITELTNWLQAQLALN